MFVVNFAVDCLLLCACGVLLKKPLFKLRLLLAGSFGALYAVVTFLMVDNQVLSFLLSLIAGAIMLKIALKFNNIFELLKGCLFLYINVLIFGGLIAVLTQLTPIVGSVSLG